MSFGGSHVREIGPSGTRSGSHVAAPTLKLIQDGVVLMQLAALEHLVRMRYRLEPCVPDARWDIPALGRVRVVDADELVVL